MLPQGSHLFQRAEPQHRGILRQMRRHQALQEDLGAVMQLGSGRQEPPAHVLVQAGQLRAVPQVVGVQQVVTGLTGALRVRARRHHAHASHTLYESSALHRQKRHTSLVCKKTRHNLYHGRYRPNQMRLLFAILPLLPLWAASYSAPAGIRPAVRRPGAASILPGGRIIAPLGRQLRTWPGPFGLAVSPNGRTVVTADSGPDRYSLTLLEADRSGQWQVRHLVAPRRLREDDKDRGEREDDEWHSVFMGLAFSGNRAVYASEGNSGRVRLVDLARGATRKVYDLNQSGLADSYTGDLALDDERGLLYVVDQANFRLAILDVRKGLIASSVRLGRLPFAIALSPDKRTAYVTNIGMFEYRALPGAGPRDPRETGLPFPAFGFPSAESAAGGLRQTLRGPVRVPGLGDPNVRESNSLCILDVRDPEQPKVEAFVRTGVPFGGGAEGGSSPSGVVAGADRVFVTNGHNDSITVIDARTHAVRASIPLRIPGLEGLRGVLPIGLALDPQSGWLLVAEAGINAVGVIDPQQGRVLGHLPAGWFPARLAVDRGTVYVANTKGNGVGPNLDPSALPDAETFMGTMRRGTVSVFSLPPPSRTARAAARRHPVCSADRQGKPHLRRGAGRYRARLQRAGGLPALRRALRPRRVGGRRPLPLQPPAHQCHPQPPRDRPPMVLQRQLLRRFGGQRGRAPLAGRRLSQCLDGEFVACRLRGPERLPPAHHGAGPPAVRRKQFLRTPGRTARSRHALAPPGAPWRSFPQLRRRFRACGGE